MVDNEKSRAGTEQEITIIGQELKLADQLAVQRTALAADRTMLAGVRTSMSFIGFGFTIFNVLKYLQEHSSVKLMRLQTPRNIALVMVMAGTIPLVVMMVQYSRILKRMGKSESIFTNPNFQMAGVIFLLGTILLVSLVASILLM
jgi:putative membrane protein